MYYINLCLLVLLHYIWTKTILHKLYVVAKLYIWQIELQFNFNLQGKSRLIFKLNWWKGKPSGTIACTRKEQPRFYWSCSSVVMNNATPLTPPSSAWAELHFKCKQHTCTFHDPWEPEKYNYTTLLYFYLYCCNKGVSTHGTFEPLKTQ